MAKSKEAQFGGVKLVILGVIIVIVGIYVASLRITTYTTQNILGISYSVPTGVINLEPLGLVLILIGVAITILGIWKWTSNI